MAKSKSFFGLRKGSTKTMTFSVLKGQQVTKDRVTDVANPRTHSQMNQRMMFAQAVKFYKHAQQNFFKFAFESKKSFESDYNVFVRLNSMRGCAVDRKNFVNNNYPSIGLFQLAEGSLQIAKVKWNSANSAVDLTAAVKAGATTIAALSKGILSTYSDLQEGDIVTLVQIASNITTDTAALVENEKTIWVTVQFVINTSNQTLITEALGEDFFCIEGALSWPALRMERPSACAVIFSRNTPYGLKVSDSILVPNQNAADRIRVDTDPIIVHMYEGTWGAKDNAILQGSLVKKKSAPRPVPPAPTETFQLSEYTPTYEGKKPAFESGIRFSSEVKVTTGSVIVIDGNTLSYDSSNKCFMKNIGTGYPQELTVSLHVDSNMVITRISLSPASSGTTNIPLSIGTIVIDGVTYTQAE